MKNGDQPAFAPSTSDPNYIQGHEGWCFGLTKREYFAAMALQGILARNNDAITNGFSESSIAQLSIYLADELLKQLDK